VESQQAPSETVSRSPPASAGESPTGGLYVELAKSLNIKLVTTDQRLKLTLVADVVAV
jgi:hypothetical protein